MRKAYPFLYWSRSAAYAGGALGVAFATGLFWWQSRAALSASPEAHGTAIRRNESRLRKPDGASIRAPASPVAPVSDVRPDAVRTPEALLAQTRAALEDEDLNRFSLGFFALLDAGEPAHDAILALIPEFMARKDALFGNPKNQTEHAAVCLGILSRTPALGGVLDAILGRDGEPDVATQLALNLYEGGAQSRLPRDRQVEVLLRLLRQGDSTDPADSIPQRAAIILLSGLKAVEALPALERMVLDGKPGRQQALLDAAAALGGAEAAASFQRLLERAKDPDLRRALASSLGRMKGPQASEMLWALEAGNDMKLRRQVIGALASNPENLDRILERIRDPRTAATDRSLFLSGLLDTGDAAQKTQVQDALWGLYEADPSRQDALLQQLLAHRHPRAGDVLIRRLKAGQLDEPLLSCMGFLEPRLIGENGDMLCVLAANPSLSLSAKVHLCQALLHASPATACRAYFSGFHVLPENERLKTLYKTPFLQGIPELKDMLHRIAFQDPSEGVRQTAAYQLKVLETGERQQR